MPFQKGNKLSKGRPKGETLKEWVRRQLLLMDDKERKIFLKSIPNEMLWKMAEGNPANATDITTKGKPIIELAKEIVEKNDINISSESNSEG